MQGTLRLILASFVVIYHARLGSPVLAAAAVVCFYMISGYAMAGLAGTLMTGAPFWSGARRFWLDRFLRVYPPYLVWAALAAYIHFGLGRASIFMLGPLDRLNIIGQITLVPLQAQEFVPSFQHFRLLPQAWTLGTEFSFYVVLPYIWRSRNALWAAYAIGCTTLALATQGIIPAVAFSYQMLPGTLPFFLLGYAIFKRDRALITALAAALVLIALGIVVDGKLGLATNIPIIVALAAGPPALAWCARRAPWRYDILLGHASYGAYLCHVPLMLCMPPLSIGVMAPLVTVASVVGGIMTFWCVGAPADRLRRAIRRRAGVTGSSYGPRHDRPRSASIDADQVR